MFGRQATLAPLRLFVRFSHNEYLSLSNRSGVREIVLNHAKTRNSLSYNMMSALVEVINTEKDNPNLRAVVISACGPVFSAGHNLKELALENGIEQHQKVFKMATDLMMSIVKSPVPIIAKVNGLAAAAGCQLVATCDIAVCSVNSKFSTPGANFGIFCSTPGIAVSRTVPKATALHMLLTGEALTADEAKAVGLVTKIVPENELDLAVNTIVDKICQKSRAVVSLGKEFYYKQLSLKLEEAYCLGEQIMVKNVNMCDGQEGITSFAQKRKPVWRHIE